MSVNVQPKLAAFNLFFITIITIHILAQILSSTHCSVQNVSQLTKAQDQVVAQLAGDGWGLPQSCALSEFPGTKPPQGRSMREGA